MQFINIAVVILIVNINLFEGGLLGFPVFAGDYDDLNADWYAQVGKTIAFTLFLNIFTPHASKLFWPLLKILKRCLDRGCSTKMVVKEEGEEARVNSKSILQSQLELLYTGDQISSHYVYAQNYTYIYCIMMYSTGMPILYLFGAIFFTLLYWIYKFLLLKYYQRTSRFNAGLPINATSWMRAALLLHIIVGGLMVTNSSILPDSENYEDTSEEKIARKVF